MPISRRWLLAAEWTEGFRYEDPDGSGFITYRTEGYDNITITHQWKTQEGKKGRVKFSYCVFGKTTDSPSEAIRLYNAIEKQRVSGRHHAAGSVEQIKARKAAGGGRRNVWP